MSNFFSYITLVANMKETEKDTFEKMLEFVKKEFEERLKELTDQRFYSIYMIRFYERTEKGKIVSVAYISEKTGIDQRRVIECLNSIQICFEVYCLKDLQEKMKEEKEMLKE